MQFSPRQPDVVSTLLSKLDEISPLLRSHSRQAETERRLVPPMIEALRDGGFYRMFRPVGLGGFGLDPVSEFTVAEAMAAVDSAAAWNVQVCNAGELYGGWFGEAASQEVFGARRSIVAGAFNPRRRAVRVDGGYRLTGITPFTSNCHGADWLMGLADAYNGDELVLDVDGSPQMLITLVPAHEFSIIENWETLGLAGTGSHDVEIDDVFVPAHRAVPFTPEFEPAGAYDNPLSRMAIWVTAASHATVALGIARAAIDDLIELGSKVPAYADSAIASRIRVQTNAAKARALLCSARAYFHQSFDVAWSGVVERGELTMAQKADCQLATTHAVTASAQAVDLVHSCVGTSGIRRSHNFEKYFRDVHVTTQHAFVSEARLEAVGQIMFGLEPDWPFFAF